MNGLRRKNEFGEIRFEIKPAMFRVQCPHRAGCPYFGENRPIVKKRRCYGRLFDLANTNGVVWFRYRCQRTKRVLLMKQMGAKLIFGDEGDQDQDPDMRIPEKFTSSDVQFADNGFWMFTKKRVDSYLNSNARLTERSLSGAEPARATGAIMMKMRTVLKVRHDVL